MPRQSKRQKQNIAVVGAGTLATALAHALHSQGYRVSEIVARNNPQSLRRARALAKQVKSRATALDKAQLVADIVWLCVPDDSVATVASQLAESRDWSGKMAVHSSGALSSDSLAPLKRKGAEIVSAHPLMTFVSSSLPQLTGVPFAVEGDAIAVAKVSAIIRSVGSKLFQIGKQEKPAYHAFGFFASPAIVGLIAAAFDVGKLAGLNAKRARSLMEPIVRQTIDNCFHNSLQEAFSGPVRRGDVETIRKHLEVLRQEPDLRDLYRSLVRVALKSLPSAKSEQIARLIKGGDAQPS